MGIRIEYRGFHSELLSALKGYIGGLHTTPFFTNVGLGNVDTF